MKIRDKVRIIACNTHHELEIGSVVTIHKLAKAENGKVYYKTKDQNIGGEMWSFEIDECEPAEISEETNLSYKASTIVEYYRIYQSYLLDHELQDDTNSITVDQLVDFVENHILNG